MSLCLPHWRLKIKMRDKKQIQELISKMHLLPDSEVALIGHTTEIYNKFKEKGIMRTYQLRKRIAVSAFLACDGKVCVALPKLRRAADSSISGGNIGKARRELNIPRGTAHEKLDSLCHVCHVSDEIVISRAHDYVALMDGTSSPTMLAATALSLAHDETLSVYPLLLQENIIRATGIHASSIYTLKGHIVERRKKK